MAAAITAETAARRITEPDQCAECGYPMLALVAVRRNRATWACLRPYAITPCASHDYDTRTGDYKGGR